MHCLYGGYNLHRFSDALGLVLLCFVSFVDITIIISRRALAREGDYEMMSVCACVCVCVS